MGVRRAYDPSMAPPGPVASVILVNHQTGERTAVLPGKVDTGSDVTIIPHDIAVRLGLELEGTAWLRGTDRRRTHHRTYYTAVEVEQYEVGVIGCVAANRDNILLGRDILNRFFLTLDGPNLTFTLER